MAKTRPLMDLKTAELREQAEQGLRLLGDVLEELVERSGSPGNRLFDELRQRRPGAGRLDPPTCERTHSVYVIELDPAVSEKGAFRQKNKGQIPGEPCFYVGMSAHPPEKRLQQHLSGENAGRFTKEFGRRLRPDLYEDRNPLTRREAKIEEKALARELREQGYGVWQN